MRALAPGEAGRERGAVGLQLPGALRAEQLEWERPVAATASISASVAAVRTRGDLMKGRIAIVHPRQARSSMTNASRRCLIAAIVGQHDLALFTQDEHFSNLPQLAMA
jgi:predicted nucleic acid-binding protein